MPIFNPEYLTNPTESLSTAFGIPTCFLDLSINALQLLSGPVLGQMTFAVEEGRKNASVSIGELFDETFQKWGIMSYDTATGRLNLFSVDSDYGLDLNEASGIGATLGALAAIESLVNQGDAIATSLKSCLEDFKAWQQSTGTSETVSIGGVGTSYTPNDYADNYQAAQAAILTQKALAAQTFIDQCNATLGRIGTVLAERQSEAVAQEAGGSCSIQGYSNEDSCVAAGGIWTPLDEPIFRLSFGPPVSKLGVFILSEDGLYYDSQNRDYNGKDIPSASDIGLVIDSEAWKLNYPANLGGRGTVVTLDDVNQYVDTFFDPNKIDDTLFNYYDQDHFLAVLESQKQKLLLDTSGQILELLSSGYDEKSALVINHRQSLISVISSFTEKIDKRKKQIEIAVKASTEFGSDTVFSPGEIPINDFSYLSSVNLNISLEQQERLVFETGSVENVVLPIKPIFVRNYGAESSQLNLPFSVPTIGVGSIIVGGSVSSITSPTLSITDSIITEKLFGVYNFLRPRGVAPGPWAPPISAGEGLDTRLAQFGSINCVSLGTSENAQLVGRNTELFTSGLSVPYFGGLVRLDPTTRAIVDYGSIARLPDTQNFQNFMYNPEGATFECWIHVPDYGSAQNYHEQDNSIEVNPNAEGGGWADYNYYKLILANENTGGSNTQNVSSLVTDQGTGSVRGFVMGFSRDPVIYSPTLLIPGSDTDPGANVGTNVSSTTASSCFFFAPTMSIGNNSISFTPQRANCITDGYAKMTIKDDLTVKSKKFTDVSGQYMHLAVCLDTSTDSCRVYLDSTLMATSSMSTVFGTDPYRPPYLPSFKTEESALVASSFEYGAPYVNQLGNASYFNQGPQNDPNFTPWILGGGWTDGLPFDADASSGGFMGGHHGWTSGLGGHLGSVKFYSRPLSTKEVETNFESQKGYYKNILT
jgi:hypothetical protein